MKKRVPNTIDIEVPYDVDFFEGLHMMLINSYLAKGYSISYSEFDIYCAILIKQNGIHNLPTAIFNYCFNDDALKESVRFHKIRLLKEANTKISDEDEVFFFEYAKQNVNKRKEIVRKEIHRTGINEKKLTLTNSTYLRTLLSFVRKLEDEITLIPWFIPIQLSFEKCVHIFIRHVEETKFADGATKKRTYFDYHFAEIYKLLKVILKQEEEKIKEHFLYVSIADETGHPEFKKDYMNNRIKFDGDTFALAINTNGYITKFHQQK